MKPHYTLSELKTTAASRWPEIHAALGISPKLLNGKHQPCPYCGGKDRYRYTNHEQGGGFICNQCTPQGGSGFDLLMLVFGYDFQTALNAVASALGMSSETMPTNAPRITPEAQTELKPYKDTIERLNAILAQSKPITHGCPVYQYLQGRGLTLTEPLPPLHHHPALSYWHDGQHIGDFPAMIAKITNTSGELMGLHITYLQANYSKPYSEDERHTSTGYTKLTLSDYPDAPAKKMQARYSGALKGAAVHLHQPDEQGRLIVAEGIETALAARAMFGLPAVAALSAWGMGVFEPPANCTQLFIVADNDPNRAGFKAAHRLAVNAIKAGIEAYIWQPDTIGYDALDEYNHRKEAAK